MAEQIALNVPRAKKNPLKKKRLAPAHYIEPMKALGTEVIPTGEETWHCEIKFDGYRAIAVINDHSAALWSRTENPLDYPEVIPALEKLPCHNAVIDGEIVALDAKGRSHFQKLQSRDLGKRPPILFYAFDLLFHNGEPLMSEPIEQRRAALEKLIRKPSRTLQLSPFFQVDPALFLAKSKEQGLEGMILKRAGSCYESGRRSGGWLKVKNLNEQEFVIGGYTPPRNSREYIGALLIGYYDHGQLFYAGKVGTGFTARSLESLYQTFAPLKTKQCPFANLPLAHRSRFGAGMTPAVMRTVTWLKPKLVSQIKFAEWTEDRILRQPVFLGLRKEKSAKSVKREAAAV